MGIIEAIRQKMRKKQPPPQLNWQAIEESLYFLTRRELVESVHPVSRAFNVVSERVSVLHIIPHFTLCTLSDYEMMHGKAPSRKLRLLQRMGHGRQRTRIHHALLLGLDEGIGGCEVARIGALMASFHPHRPSWRRMVPYQPGYALSELSAQVPKFVRFAVSTVDLSGYAIVHPTTRDLDLPVEWKEWLKANRHAFDSTALLLDAQMYLKSKTKLHWGNVFNWLLSEVVLTPSLVNCYGRLPLTMPQGLLACHRLVWDMEVGIVGNPFSTGEALARWLVEASSRNAHRRLILDGRWRGIDVFETSFISAVNKAFTQSRRTDFPTFIAGIPFMGTRLDMELFSLSTGDVRMALELWNQPGDDSTYILYCCREEERRQKSTADPSQSALTSGDVEAIRERYYGGQKMALFDTCDNMWSPCLKWGLWL